MPSRGWQRERALYAAHLDVAPGVDFAAPRERSRRLRSLAIAQKAAS